MTSLIILWWSTFHPEFLYIHFLCVLWKQIGLLRFFHSWAWTMFANISQITSWCFILPVSPPWFGYTHYTHHLYLVFIWNSFHFSTPWMLLESIYLHFIQIMYYSTTTAPLKSLLTTPPISLHLNFKITLQSLIQNQTHIYRPKI